VDGDKFGTVHAAEPFWVDSNGFSVVTRSSQQNLKHSIPRLQAEDGDKFGTVYAAQPFWVDSGVLAPGEADEADPETAAAVAAAVTGGSASTGEPTDAAGGVEAPSDGAGSAATPSKLCRVLAGGRPADTSSPAAYQDAACAVLQLYWHSRHTLRMAACVTEDSACPPAGAEAAAEPPEPDMSPERFARRYERRTRLNWVGASVFCCWVLCCAAYLVLRVTKTLQGLGSLLPYGVFVLFVEVLGATATAIYGAPLKPVFCTPAMRSMRHNSVAPNPCGMASAQTIRCPSAAFEEPLT